eukprot:1816381-Rhodomonas_salina.1
MGRVCSGERAQERVHRIEDKVPIRPHTQTQHTHTHAQHKHKHKHRDVPLTRKSDTATAVATDKTAAEPRARYERA